jgi:hypothetical protein
MTLTRRSVVEDLTNLLHARRRQAIRDEQIARGYQDLLQAVFDGEPRAFEPRRAAPTPLAARRIRAA